MYRHGDVALTKVDAVPDGAKEIFSGDQYVVAEGEVTGHAHRVQSSGLVVWEYGGERFLVVNDPGSTITHEEHGKQIVSPGVYRIGIQKEYDPFADRIREVAD